VPFEEMPHAFNPEGGVLLNCNNRIEPDGYPYYLGGDYMNGYRANRLNALITERPVLSMQDHRDLQMDFGSAAGLELAAQLENFSDPDPDVTLALGLLREWDGMLDAGSLGGSVYRISRYFMLRNLLDPAVGQEFAERVMGVGFHPLLAGGNEFYGHDTTALLRLLDNPDSWWVQNAGGRSALISSSLKQAVDWLRANAGNDPSDWQWGQVNQLSFEHPMSLQKPFDEVFDRGPYSIGGDTDTPLQIAKHGIDPGIKRVVGPSFRQIIDMGDLSKSTAMYAPGQSGRLASPFYDNLIEPWLNGEYHPMLWTREQVESETHARLVLNPG
jgi:penicillin amidase